MRVTTVTTSDTVQIEIPRSALTVIERAHSASQKTSRSALGIDSRPFLALTRSYRAAGGDVIAVGKLRLVEVDPFLDWLKRRAAPKRKTAEPMTELEALEAEFGIVGRK